MQDCEDEGPAAGYHDGFWEDMICVTSSLGCPDERIFKKIAHLSVFQRNTVSYEAYLRRTAGMKVLLLVTMMTLGRT